MSQATVARRQGSFWQAFTRPRTFLPTEHGSWVLFAAPLAVGALVGRAWNPQMAALAVAALAVFLSRQPLDLALKSWRGKRPRYDAAAVAAWLAIDGLVGLAAAVYLWRATQLWGLAPLACLALALMAVQLWALQTRLHRTAWVEVLGTLGLGLGAAAMYYVARKAWSPTALGLALLPALQGAGSVLDARWRLRRRRLAVQKKDYTRLPRAGLLAFHAASLGVAVGLAALGWAPWGVTLLYLGLLLRVAWTTRRAAGPDRSVTVIGATEGLVTLASVAWLVLAFWYS